MNSTLKILDGFLNEMWGQQKIFIYNIQVHAYFAFYTYFAVKEINIYNSF